MARSYFIVTALATFRIVESETMKTPQIKPMAGMAPLGFMSPVARDQAALAQRKANAPLRPTVAQASMDVGLFGDDARQSDLIDAVRALDVKIERLKGN